MKYILLVLSLFYTSSVNADYIAGFDFSYLLEEEVNGQEYTLQDRGRIKIGYQKEEHSYLLEYSFYEEESQNGISSITNASREVVFWYLRKLDLVNWDKWVTEIGGGVGSNWSKITSRLGSISTTHTSDREIVLGLGLGARYPLVKRLWYGFDFRAMYSPAYTIDPTLEITPIRLMILWN